MAYQYLANLFTNIKVQKQLYLIFFTAVFIPVMTVGNYLVYNTRSQLFEHYAAQSYSDNLRVKSLLLDLTSNIFTQAESLASDQDLIALLVTDHATPEDGAAATNAYDGIISLLSKDMSIQEISIHTFNQSLPDSRYIHPVTEDVAREPWFLQASSSVTPFWSVERESDKFGNEAVVLCLHTRIFLPQIHSFAILGLTVSNNHIRNRIENGTLNTVMWLNQEEIFYTSEKQLAVSGLDRYGANPNSYYLGKITMDDATVIGCVSSLATAYSENIFYMASLNYGGYPYVNRITGIYLSILVMVLLITSLFIYTFSRYFSRRIITLRETMYNASRGNYEIIDTYHGEDEISQVFADLNIMIQDILKKEASVYETQIRTQELINQQQQIEYKMLASQINPHFLYNTLETIRMRSLKAGNHEIANAVKLLGKSMRYVLDNTTTSITTLARELDHIETYLAIQKLRFHDRVNYSLKISPQLNPQDYQIMPLLIQPIVENAILHGLEEVEQNGRIILHIHQKDGRLYIQVFDNGRGMTAKELAVMKQNIHHHPQDSSRSIGLYNISQRIRLYYGSDYWLQIKSKKHLGTLATMVLPATRVGGTEHETIHRR